MNNEKKHTIYMLYLPVPSSNMCRHYYGLFVVVVGYYETVSKIKMTISE